jgi:hypothetical protein
LAATTTIRGIVSPTACHWELKVERFIEDEQRPRFACAIVHQETHKVWEGFNRAQAAVLELAVLTTRLNMLPPRKSRTSQVSRNRDREDRRSARGRGLGMADGKNQCLAAGAFR